MLFLFKINKYLHSSFVKSSSALLFLLFIFGFRFAGAQTIETIHEELEEAGKYVYSDSPEKAIPLLRKVHKDAKSIGHKQVITRIGYTLAIIYFNSTDYNKVINLDEEFLKTGNEIKDYENVSHIHRLKGCAYAELGLLSKGSEELEQALEYARKIPPGNPRQYALSLIYSNLGNQLAKGGAPQDSIFTNIKKCIAEAEKITETDNASISKKYSLIAYSYIIMANEYEKEEKMDLAENYYLKSLSLHNTKSVPLVERVVLLNQLGYFYYEKKEFEKSIKYAQEGLAVEKKSSIPQLRRDLFEILSKCYMELHETENSKKYLDLFTTLNDSISNINRKAIDGILNDTISTQKELHQNNNTREKVIYSLLAIVLIVFGVSLFLYYKKQKQIKKIQMVLKQLKEKEQGLKTNSLIINKPSKQTDEKTSPMSAEAEEKLLEKLHDFEQGKLFLERKVSLPYVAGEIETNTKYLSYIIKTHKGKDFNDYINDLRINYIVQKITQDPVYRQYKINTLAEECGFSSHSKFATVFKTNIGVSPSEFIRYFKQNKGLEESQES